MPIELEKESKNLNKFIEYVEAQVNYTQEEIKSDLLERGLSEEEATYVMTFYKPHIKQRMFSRSFSFCGRIRRLEYCLNSSLKFEITAKRLCAASRRVL